MLVGPMQYVSNPKHSDPWQRGRRGSLCPLEVRPLAQELLDSSVADGTKRYAMHEGKAYCAQQTPRTFGMDIPSGGSMFQCESARLGAASVA